MHNEVTLPSSKYINASLGLKYLNGNRKLYLKVLNSFITRYHDLQIKALNDDEFKSTMHTIKGLSATLGMQKLSTLSKQLNELKTKELLLEFSEVLTATINDINRAQTKSVLIIEDKHHNIDILVENLEENYDIIIAISIDDALESLLEEQINLVLLSKEVSNLTIIQRLEEKNIPIIYLPNPLNMPILVKKIQDI